jgi:hypothetical protein
MVLMDALRWRFARVVRSLYGLETKKGWWTGP